MEEESTTQENSAKNSNSQPQDSDSKQSRTKTREHEKMLVTSEASFSPCAYLDHIWIIFGSYIEPRVGHMRAHAHRKPENLEKPSPLSGKSLTV